MLKDSIISLKDFILDNNSYFSSGYGPVFFNDKGILEVFPNDKLGDYFYIRHAAKATVDSTAAMKISDCATPMGVRSECFLIACVREADNDRLINNLVHTIQGSGRNAVVTGLTYEREAVVLQEMPKHPKEDREKALQNLSNWTIVSVQFNLTVRVKPVKNLAECIENPCKTC